LEYYYWNITIGILLLEYYFLTSLTPGGSDWAKRKAGDEAAGPTGGCYVEKLFLFLMVMLLDLGPAALRPFGRLNYYELAEVDNVGVIP